MRAQTVTQNIKVASQAAKLNIKLRIVEEAADSSITLYVKCDTLPLKLCFNNGSKEYME